MYFLSEGTQAESGLWLPDLHYKCWVHGPCVTWSGPDGHERCHSLLCEISDLVFSFQVGASYSGEGCLLPVWTMTGNLTKAHPGKSLMIFLSQWKRKLTDTWVLSEVPNVWWSLSIHHSTVPPSVAQELWGGRCKAIYGRPAGLVEDRSFQIFRSALLASATGDRLCQWAVVSCRFAWSVNLNEIPERWWD